MLLSESNESVQVVGVDETQEMGGKLEAELWDAGVAFVPEYHLVVLSKRLYICSSESVRTIGNADPVE